MAEGFGLRVQGNNQTSYHNSTKGDRDIMIHEE